MKRNSLMCLAAIAVLAAAPFSSKATIFFSDSFTNGSTIISTSPAAPTPTNTAYQVMSGKAWVPNPPTLNASGLRFGIAATTSGSLEVQALFATNAIALVLPDDYIQLEVVFTNVSGILTASGQLGVGLYNSGGVQPFPGGTNNATSAITLTGYAQNWLGYMGIIGSPSGNTSRLYTRPAQTITTGNNQDLVCNGSASQAYQSATSIGASYGEVSLTTGSTYTEVFTVTRIDATTLGITNKLYSGAGTGGTVITNTGATVTGATLLTSGFDAFAIGYRARASGAANTFNLASVLVSGSVTAVTGPPTIDTQPVAVSVATNGSCFFEVAATGYSMTYQWYRNGSILSNGGNITGATSSKLIISSANVGDVFSGANGYYCVVTGAGPYSTNSVTNSLSLVPAKNLVWSGSGNVWDLNTTANWIDPVNPATFNFGDNVTFDDTGAGNANVTLTGNFLSASKWTITGNTAYAFGGTGSFAGTGSLVYDGSQLIQMNVANTHSGGTTISNSTAYLYLQQYQSLGTGPLTVSKAGGKMEVVPTGSATVGIPSDVNVLDDFTIQFDGAGSFAGVIFGNISGTSGKTLTLTPQIVSNTNRYRVYGTNTVCAANIILTGNPTDQAQYNGTVLACYGATGSQTYNGTISGEGGIIQRAAAILILNTANTFAGGTTPTTGTIGLGHDNALGSGPLIVAPELPNATGSGGIMAVGGARTIANTIQYPSGTNNQTLIISGTNNITFTSPINLAGVDGLGTPTNRTFQVNNTGATTLSGIISDGGTGLGLVKTGTNTLYLNAANTYSGLTTVSAGVLAGSGSIAGSVLVTSTNASVGGGAASGIGTLSVGGSLNLTNGGGFFRVNRSGFASDLVSVTGGLTNLGTGKITVTNLGATLQAGDTFAVFNKAVVGGSTLNITGGLTSGLTWSNNLAANGSIVVIVAGTDLAITKTGSATVLPAANFNYTITVTNQGAALASSVVVTDTIPAGVTFVSASGGGVNNAGVVSWALGSLTPAQSSSLTLTVTAPLFGSITNKASVSSATTDLVPANDISAQVVTVVTPSSSIPKLTNVVSGNSIALSWPVDHTGWRLQVQTNSLATGLSGNWSTVSGSTNINSTSITINPANGSVYYRLVYP